MKMHVKKENKIPFFSIVILTRLTDIHSLQKCLDSLSNSSFQNFEIILVINSYSTDLNFQIETLPKKVRCFLLPDNRGVYGYTVGVLNSKGENIIFLDDDCTVKKDTLIQFVKALQTIPKTVGIVSATVYDPINRIYQYAFNNEHDRRSMYTFAGGASLIRAAVFKKVGYYDSDFFLWMHEDDFGLRVLSVGYSIFHSANIIVYHHNKKSAFRSVLAFTAFRNKAWLNVKHFSLLFYPLIVLRDFLWIMLYPFRVGSALAFFIALFGYFWGYVSMWRVLKRRQVLPLTLQKEYVLRYLTYHPEH